jgi:uncharacterized membrane protein
MQMRMRDFACDAAFPGNQLSKRYHRLFWLWVGCGFPAFEAVLAIFWLMIAKPSIHPWPVTLGGGP